MSLAEEIFGSGSIPPLDRVNSTPVSAAAVEIFDSLRHPKREAPTASRGSALSAAEKRSFLDDIRSNKATGARSLASTIRRGLVSRRILAHVERHAGRVLEREIDHSACRKAAERFERQFEENSKKDGGRYRVRVSSTKDGGRVRGPLSSRRAKKRWILAEICDDVFRYEKGWKEELRARCKGGYYSSERMLSRLKKEEMEAKEEVVKKNIAICSEQPRCKRVSVKLETIKVEKKQNTCTTGVSDASEFSVDRSSTGGPLTPRGFTTEVTCYSSWKEARGVLNATEELYSDLLWRGDPKKMARLVYSPKADASEDAEDFNPTQMLEAAFGNLSLDKDNKPRRKELAAFCPADSGG